MLKFVKHVLVLGFASLLSITISISGQETAFDLDEQDAILTFIGRAEPEADLHVYSYQMSSGQLTQLTTISVPVDQSMAWVPSDSPYGNAISYSEADPDAHGVPFFHVNIIDLEGQVLSVYETSQGHNPPSLYWSPNGRYFVAEAHYRGGSTELTIVDAASMQRHCELGYSSGGQGFIWINDQTLLQTKMGLQHLVSIAETGSCSVTTIEASDQIVGDLHTISANPNGAMVVFITSTRDGYHMYAYDNIQAGTSSNILTTLQPPSNVSISKDGANLAWTMTENGRETIHTWNFTRPLYQNLEGTSPRWVPRNTAIGRLIYLNREGQLALWDEDEGTLWEQSIALIDNLDFGLSMSSNGRWLAAVNEEYHIHIIDLETGDIVFTLEDIEVDPRLSLRWTAP
ncbi:MAG: hypothetical protein H7Y09_12960 [Chitinophagaceae bacterium]|nr:hypothetical protein [Anaerolineae bacterium]